MIPFWVTHPMCFTQALCCPGVGEVNVTSSGRENSNGLGVFFALQVRFPCYYRVYKAYKLNVLHLPILPFDLRAEPSKKSKQELDASV